MLGHALIRGLVNVTKIEYGRIATFSACFLQGRGHSHMHMEERLYLVPGAQGYEVIVAGRIYM